MKKFLLYALLICVLPAVTLAQGSGAIPDNSGQTKNASFGNRLFGGGDLSLQFGTFTLIYISPVIGYKLTSKLGAGVGPIYSYVKDNTWKPAYETSTYGGKVFAQYSFTRNFMGYTEYQQVNADVIDDFSYKVVRRNIPFWFVGGAYVAPIGARSGIMAMLLFDLIEDPYSYYSNPTFRLGFTTGF